MADNKMLGIVFSNMHDNFLAELTMHRTTASVPFGGRYRLVDFTLSNMVNSGIANVGIIAKSNYHSLMDHVGSGKEWDLARKRGGLTILPPFSRSGSGGIYRGNLEALAGIMGYIRSSTAPYVALSDCCLVTNLDMRKVLEAHQKSGAEITIVYTVGECTAPRGDCVAIETDKDGFLTEVSPHHEGGGGVHKMYTNIAVIAKDTLIHMVNNFVNQNKYSFVQDVLTTMSGTRSVYCYELSGCSLTIHDMQSYFEANMSLLDSNVRRELFNQERPIYTKVRDEVPAKYGLSSVVANSLVADGCIIEGEVRNSVIFRGVRVGKGARVENCILMQGTVVEDNASLDYVIADKNVLVRDGRKLAGYLSYPLFLPKNQHI
ncbi:MAG: glucose-1-phosphate adenylyltransferase subunit GlgD [Angelakisella sp.]